MKIARSEWKIENGLHYRRDYTLREDWSMLECGASQKNNASLNNIVVGLAALSGADNLAYLRREIEYNPNRAIALLTEPLLSSC